MSNFSAVVALLLSATAFADTIEMTDTGTKQEGVYVAENSIYYVVVDPKTGKTESIEKSKARVTLSPDHVALGAQWRQGLQSNTPASDSKTSETSDTSPTTPDKGVITIKHKGNYRPDPSTSKHIAAGTPTSSNGQKPSPPRTPTPPAAARQRQLLQNQQQAASRLLRNEVAAERATIRAEQMMRRSGRAVIP